jgi:hypothetical protein
MNNSVIKFPRRPFGSQGRAALPVPTPMSYDNEPMVLERPEDRALTLAQTQDFFAMCEHGLWGAEGDLYKQEFGEMLRGLIEEFLPRNTWELQLLSGVAVAAWKVRRLSRTQANVFNAHADSRVTGKHGLPIAVSAAGSLEPELAQAQAGLQSAIRLLKESRATSRAERKQATRSRDDGFIPLEDL